MKKLIIVISLISIIVSCKKDNDEIDDLRESFVKLENVSPKSGSSISSSDTLHFTVHYNISLEELEGEGFNFKSWIGLDDNNFSLWGSAEKLTTRNATKKLGALFSEQFYTKYKGRKVKFLFTVDREEGTLDHKLANSEQIEYYIK